MGFSETMSHISEGDSMIDAKNQLLASINKSTAMLLDVGQRENTIDERVDKEFKKEIARQNAIIERGKAEWREKLLNTIYANRPSSIPT